MKYLFMLAFLALVWWLWAKGRAIGGGDASPRQEKAPEKMVTCAHCGVHLPESEGIAEAGRFYCSEAHRLADAATER